MPDTNTEFWELVGGEKLRADPKDVKVGDAVNIEYGTSRFVGIVEDAWDHPEKGRQIRFRHATIADCYDPPTITLVASQ